MKRKGILIGEDGDLNIRPVRDGNGILNSGLVIGDSLYQNQYVILRAHKGELKEFPVLGVGLSDIVNDQDIAGWSDEIKSQFENDGMRVGRVKFDRNMDLEIDADYEG